MSPSRPHPNPHFPVSSGSPPRPPPRDPLVVPILDPPDRPDLVQRSEESPPAPELGPRPVHRGCGLELPTSRLHHPHRPIHLLATHSQSLRQSFLLVRPRIKAARPVVALDPARQPNSKLALAVVHQDQPINRHTSKLHCRCRWLGWIFPIATTSARTFSSAT